MLGAVLGLRQIQADITKYNENQENPISSYPIDVSKIDEIKTDPQKLNALADHMIAERPSGGYVSFVQIQTAFDKFFSDGNNTDVLSILNAAKGNGKIEDMRVAIEDPDLGITLPQGYGALSLQERNNIALFLFHYVEGDFKNKGQVQYMVELGVLANPFGNKRNSMCLRTNLIYLQSNW